VSFCWVVATIDWFGPEFLVFEIKCGFCLGLYWLVLSRASEGRCISFRYFGLNHLIAR